MNSKSIPNTPDHVTTYGPVFFRVAAWSYEAFGFSLRAFRLVSLLGAFMIAGAAVSLASTFGLSRAQRVWRAVILLIGPTVGSAATNGRMDSLAVGLSMAGLAVLVAGVAEPERRTLTRGAIAGVCLVLAALTTPRSVPFGGTCLLGLGVLIGVTRMDRSLCRMTMATAGAFGAGIVIWSILAPGESFGWIRMLTSIVPRVGEEVTFAEGATRDWRLAERPWTLLSLIVGFPATIIVAWHLRKILPDVSPALRHAALLAIGVTWVNVAVVLAVANLTFSFAVYFNAPLLAVAVALPAEWFPISRVAMTRAICTVLVVYGGGRVLKYATAAATWHARDPRLIRQFAESHVPPDSQVIGRTRFYFFAVERAGSAMVSLSGESFASWTRLAPKPREFRITPVPGVRRFLLMPVEGAEPALPDGSVCPDARLVAEYHPPADTIAWLGPLARRLYVPGYPRSALWELPDACVHEPGRIIDRTRYPSAG